MSSLAVRGARGKKRFPPVVSVAMRKADTLPLKVLDISETSLREPEHVLAPSRTYR